MVVYHVQVLDDATGRAYVAEHQEAIQAAGGEVRLSPSFGHGPAILIIELPEGVAVPEAVAATVVQEETHEQPAQEAGNGLGDEAGTGSESIGIDRS